LKIDIYSSAGLQNAKQITKDVSKNYHFGYFKLQNLQSGRFGVEKIVFYVGNFNVEHLK
jgi:hypothetical protein